MSQPSANAATTVGELVSLKTIRKKNTCHLVAIRRQPIPAVSPEELRMYKNSGYWPRIAEMHMEGMISLSPDPCIVPNPEKR